MDVVKAVDAAVVVDVSALFDVVTVIVFLIDQTSVVGLILCFVPPVILVEIVGSLT